MAEHRSIWYFVGLMLVTMGILVALAGVLDAINPPSQPTAFANALPSLWWGMVMTVCGLVFYLTHRGKS